MTFIPAFFNLDSFGNALFVCGRASFKIVCSRVSVLLTSFLELTASWQKGESSFTKNISPSR
jgi:hypothetical protein